MTANDRIEKNERENAVKASEDKRRLIDTLTES